MTKEFITKDSGKRQEYSTGMRRDLQDDKPMFELCTPEDTTKEDNMLYRWAMLMNRGAIKYGRRNWELACTKEELERFKGSALRHMMQWLNGWDSEEDHAAAVMFNIQCAEYVKRRLKEQKTAAYIPTLMSDVIPKEELDAYSLMKKYEEGYNKALDDNNILHGQAAKDFLKEMEDKEITPEQNAFLKECEKVFNETKRTDKKDIGKHRKR